MGGIPYDQGVSQGVSDPSSSPALSSAAPALHHLALPAGSGAGGSPRRLAWWQWGSPTAPRVVVCVHGLTRQGRDFDVLSQALVEQAAGQVRVVCPDIAGRGYSDWLPDPMGYGMPTYACDMAALLAHLHQQAPVSHLDWVGTSMGGLIAMAFFGTPALGGAWPLKRLVFNDVGPQIEWAAIERIKTYVGVPVVFDSLDQATDFAVQSLVTFGPHTREQWAALTRHQLRERPEGSYTFHYDPRIAQPFAQSTQAQHEEGTGYLWQVWDGLTAPTLLLRGADSDLLSAAAAQAMTRRGPRATLVEFPGVGHAPMLVVPDQVQAVLEFLPPV